MKNSFLFELKNFNSNIWLLFKTLQQFFDRSSHIQLCSYGDNRARLKIDGIKWLMALLTFNFYWNEKYFGENGELSLIAMWGPQSLDGKKMSMLNLTFLTLIHSLGRLCHVFFLWPFYDIFVFRENKFWLLLLSKIGRIKCSIEDDCNKTKNFSILIFLLAGNLLLSHQSEKHKSRD